MNTYIMSSWPEDVQKAYQLALKMLTHSYAPYSGLHVGAAMKLQGVDELIPGCNVENASLGATICAERTAMVQAVARFGKAKPEFIVLCSDSPHGLIPPCGMCLQVLQEFVDRDFQVYLADQAKIHKQLSFEEFLPQFFDKSMLPKEA